MVMKKQTRKQSEYSDDRQDVEKKRLHKADRKLSDSKFDVTHKGHTFRRSFEDFNEYDQNKILSSLTNNQKVKLLMELAKTINDLGDEFNLESVN